MEQTFKDFAQLKRSMLKGTTDEAVKAGEIKPVVTVARDDGEEVLAYFSRAANGREAKVGAEGGKMRSAELAAEVESVKNELEAVRGKLAEVEGARDELVEKLAEASRQIGREQGECARLRGELKKAERAGEQRNGSVNGEVEREGVEEQAEEGGVTKSGILAEPREFREAFPGELREMVLAALTEAREQAQQSRRMRRAAALGAVLGENRPSGELERRRAEVRQILKDAGYHIDPAALEKLGFRLISGRQHWKIEYADVRMPVAKTPSDYRSSMNMATELSNMCF